MEASYSASIGNVGHFLLLSAFVSIALGLYGFVQHSRHGGSHWWRYASVMYGLHAVALCGASALLFYLLLSDQFAYHYAWSHSMASLPTYYKVAAFWEGQEGSFLLWMLWHLVLGWWVIQRGGKLRPQVMAILCTIQLCLASMLLGVVVGDWKIGSSPFLLLREAMAAPIFTTNPDFVPADGMGLSPLLQNYWMVIHPPILFMGFALVSLPFSYVCAGLWTQDIDTALRQAMVWVITAVMVLGTGIVLGSIWAYETLNFGGYWNWDPVENAVYVPWLVLVAALHMLVLYVRKGVALRGSIYAVLATFWLVLYATFLVRSGVLGDSSVHAFTDAGLSGQLIFCLVVMVALSGVLLYKNHRALPTRAFSYSPRKVDFYLALGIACLALMAFQVLLPTCLPVYNAVLSGIGIQSRLAPPADAVAFYSNAQLYFACVLLLLSGIGQMLYWQRVVDRSSWLRVVLAPLLPALFVATWVIIWMGMQQLTWVLLLSACLYALFANGHMLWNLLRKQPALCAGALAHTGMACIVLGILFSSGYSRIVSTNQTGLIWHQDFPDEVNEQNILLFQHQLRHMQGYTLHYKGLRKRLEGVPGYVPAAHLELLSAPHHVRAKVDIVSPDNPSRLYAYKGDTLHIETPEKEYFEIVYRREGKPPLRIYPTAQRSNQDDRILYAPYILRGALGDVYAHVRTFADPEKRTWSEPQTVEVSPQGTFFANDYVAYMVGINRLQQVEEVPLDTGDVALRAEIEVRGPDQHYYLQPILVIKDQHMGIIYDELADLGVRVALTGVYPERNRFELQLHTTQVPWVILEVIEKPLINLLWGGVGLMVAGLCVGLWRRIRYPQL